MSKIVLLDKHGIRKIYPASDSTRIRQIAQEEDPFPAGTIIGGKRYWRESDVQDWLARQFGDRDQNGGQPPPEPGEAAGTPAAGVA